MSQLAVGHKVAAHPADAIGQWFNAGGMVQYYDYPLETLLNVCSSPKIAEEILTCLGDSRAY